MLNEGKYDSMLIVQVHLAERCREDQSERALDGPFEGLHLFKVNKAARLDNYKLMMFQVSFQVLLLLPKVSTDHFARTIVAQSNAEY